MKVKIKLIRQWGEYKIGNVADFDERKARSLIAMGTAIEVIEDKKVSAEAEEKPKEKPKVETATLDPITDIAKVETAEVTPQIPNKKLSGRKKKGGE